VRTGGVCLIILGLAAPIVGQEPQGVGQGLFPSRTVARDQPWRPLRAEERLDLLVRGSYLNPASHLRAGLVATIDHLQNDPPQWDNSLVGFRHRFADRSARFLVRDTLEAGMAGALGHEVRYVPCPCEGARRRLWHAFAGGFRTYDRNGQWRPHYSRYASVFGAEYIRYTWRPPADRDASEVATGALVQLGVGVTGRVFREFSPEIKHGFRKLRGKP
jgi:hypothetical protein